ncbi:MmgE/PrpD family protein [Pseudonocardia adelaidensis]|uniref:MmgE/PrpD family protein n=1 Tax=Pseudonocardia adelaidensis TaxID=648754 RepID=A0ABP9NLC8_9PSEU
MTESPTARIAEYAAGTAYDRLPHEVVDRAKIIVFDELACAVLGRELDPGVLVAAYVARSGGAPESTVLGTADRLPAPLAALANGTAGHADEFDGVHVTGGHPGAVIVPAAFATAERLRRGGAELINAVVLGYDVGTRLVDAVGGAGRIASVHHLHSDFLHAYGAASAAARLLGLDAGRHRHAAALTAGHAIGLRALFGEDRHISKALANGQAAAAGVTGAFMAEAGLEGNDSVLEAPGGVLDAWADPARRDRVTRGLGDDHAVLGAHVKFYSAGYPIHAPVEAALRIVADTGIATADIDAVVVHLPARTADIVDGRRMPTINLQHMLGVALVAGGLGFEDAHSEPLRRDPRVAALAARVSIERHPGIDEAPPYARGATVDVVTGDGSRHSVRIEHPRGHAHRGPVTWDDLDGKWRELLGSRIGPGRYAEALTAAKDLERVDDVSVLASLLTRRDQP